MVRTSFDMICPIIKALVARATDGFPLSRFLFWILIVRTALFLPLSPLFLDSVLSGENVDEIIKQCEWVSSANNQL